MPEPRTPHLVLVDDDDDIRHLHLCAIESLKLGKVVAVESVPALLQHLDQALSAGEPADVILMDIMMPGIDGIEGCRRVHAQPAFKDIPIVMLTSLRDDDKLTAAFDAGAIDYIIKPFRLVELRARLRSVLRLKQELDSRRAYEQELLQLNQRLIEMQAQSERTIYLDGLTGIYNRRAFDKKLHDEWQNCLKLDQSLAMILLDIDFFKRFNDCYGHQAGDQCLQAVAASLPQPETGVFAARYGGEEFALILPGSDIGQAFELAESIRCQIEALAISHVESDASPYITVSLGVACVWPSEQPDSAELVRLADLALYEAKSQGRNLVVST